MATLRTPALIHVVMAVPLCIGSALALAALSPSVAMGWVVFATVLVGAAAAVELWRRDRASQRAAVLKALAHGAQVLNPAREPSDSRWEPAKQILAKLAASAPEAAAEARESLASEFLALESLMGLVTAERALDLDGPSWETALEARQARVRQLLEAIQGLATQLEAEESQRPPQGLDVLENAEAEVKARSTAEREVLELARRARGQAHAHRAQLS